MTWRRRDVAQTVRATWSRPLARSEDLVVEEVEDELLVYDSENKRAHCLSATAARVWRACDGDSDVSALSDALELSPEVVTQALNELEALELLDTQVPKVVQAGSGNGDAGSGNGNGITRRQLTGRSARVGAGLVAGSLVYSINVTSAAATVIPFQCQIYTTRACGTDAGCCAIFGCCCCCQGGGSCKTCGATSFCSTSTPQPCAPLSGKGVGTNCSCEGKKPTTNPTSQGCCGVTGADNCGCGFGPPGTLSNGTGTQSGCCNPSNGTPCTPGAANCVPCCNGTPIVKGNSLGCCRCSNYNCCTNANQTCCTRSRPAGTNGTNDAGVCCCDANGNIPANADPCCAAGTCNA